LSGQPLNQLNKERAPLPAAAAISMLDAILYALETAHEAGIVHRDLKPSNLFVQTDRDGQVFVKLLDFGLAREQTNAQTRQGKVLLGTPAYMAPEQVRGEPVDSRTDLYALGVIAYELATGRRPFRSENMVLLLNAQL